MKKLRCPDTSCNFEMTGKDDDEVMRKAKEHGTKVHRLEQMDEEKIRSQIRNV